MVQEKQNSDSVYHAPEPEVQEENSSTMTWGLRAPADVMYYSPPLFLLCMVLGAFIIESTFYLLNGSPSFNWKIIHICTGYGLICLVVIRFTFWHITLDEEKLTVIRALTNPSPEHKLLMIILGACFLIFGLFGMLVGLPIYGSGVLIVIGGVLAASPHPPAEIGTWKKVSKVICDPKQIGFQIICPVAPDYPPRLYTIRCRKDNYDQVLDFIKCHVPPRTTFEEGNMFITPLAHWRRYRMADKSQKADMIKPKKKR